MLNYIRALVPNDVKGEILEDWYKVSLTEVSEAFQKKLLQCFIGSHFWKVYWIIKGFTKNLFLVNLHSAINKHIKNPPPS